MKILKLAVNDLFQGTWMKIRYLVFIVIILIICGNFQSMADSYFSITGDRSLSLADCLAFVCQGVPPAVQNGQMESVIVPTTWLGFMMMQLLMTLDHPVHRAIMLWQFVPH